MSLSLASMLAESAQRYPDGTRWSSGRSGSATRICGNRPVGTRRCWPQEGVGPGDRVALLMPNVPDFPRVYYAALSLGAVVVPVHCPAGGAGRSASC